MLNLKVFHIINDKNRNTCIDIFRSAAVLTVVIFHFNEWIPLGMLGVDLFFVISGLLIGGILIKDFQNENKINFFQFILQRGFKIWPSYYIFLLLGSILAFLFYHQTGPDQLIQISDLKSYLFFYQNYSSFTKQWSFRHVWSLCVEEHFYILLPLMFIFIQYFFKTAQRKNILFLFICCVILSGIIFKILTYFFTASKFTYAPTHCRIDGLAWGVLLSYFVTYSTGKIRSFLFSLWSLLAGLGIFAITILYHFYFTSEMFEKIFLHSLTPLAFFFMISGTYTINFSKLKPLQFVAYYSYNWYLWHLVFTKFFSDYIGNNFLGFIAYLVTSFITAMLFTIIIEEPALKLRRKVISKLFKSESELILKPTNP